MIGRDPADAERDRRAARTDAPGRARRFMPDAGAVARALEPPPRPGRRAAPERAGPSRALRRFGILGVPALIVFALALFVTSGLRRDAPAWADVLGGDEPAPSVTAGTAPVIVPGGSARPGIVDAPERRRPADEAPAGLESRRDALARDVARLVALEGERRRALDGLAARRRLETARLDALERRREVSAAATARLEDRQRELTRTLLALERDVERTSARERAEARRRAAEEAAYDDNGAEVAARGVAYDRAAAPARGSGSARRVFVHYSAPEPGAEALAERVARDLTGRGVVVADVRAVGFGIGANRVRYFFEGDAAAAPAVGAIVAKSLGVAGGDAPELQDFTTFEPKPGFGTIEVWVTGRQG